ncbi:MAG: hypothetical protein Q8K40_00015, partial [Ignavibacteria bacterium]|nr:hypothetical protein [Ignavibacteria bacterium]
MRVIKNHRIRCESFSSSLPSFTKAIGTAKPRFVQVSAAKAIDTSENLPYMLKKISAFEKAIKNSADAKHIILKVNEFLNGIIDYKEADLFFFDDFRLKLVSVVEPVNLKTTEFINSVFSEGILDWVLKENKPQIIP